MVLDANALFIEGNYIGVNAAGNAALPNGDGVTISGGNVQVGALGAGRHNVISGNANDGVGLHVGAAMNGVLNNYIGTDETGVLSIPNGGHGVFVQSPGSTINNVVVANNGGDGVRVFNVFPVNIGGSIHANTGLDIDLGGDGVTTNDAGDGDGGANELQNYPVILSATNAGGLTLVDGTLNSTPLQEFQVRLYVTPTCHASGFGGGRDLQQSFLITTDGAGNALIAVALPNNTPAGWFVTATATSNSGAGSTSEFSQCTAVP
jgi:hypothetical protein